MIEKKPTSIRLHPKLKASIEKIAKDNEMSVNNAINLMLDFAVRKLESGENRFVSEIVESNMDTLEKK